MSTNDDTSTCEAIEKEIMRTCSILETVANNYSESSDEALAIRNAALAYQIVHQHRGLKQKYDQLCDAFGGELTEEIKTRLRQFGIEPNELDED
jgi:hypothetical protein